MAEQIALPGAASTVKVRNPWAVLGLSLITLGIYTWFWWYVINRELSDLGRARRVEGLGENPGVSTAALIAGAWILIPGVWTMITTCRRVQRAEDLVAATPRLNGWIALLLAIVTAMFGFTAYLQHHLNRVWESASLREWTTEAAAGA